jgi:hypothetical protein
LALLAAGIAIIFKVYAKLACYLLALLLLIFIITMYVPHLSDQMAMGGLLKDMALMGAALFMAAEEKK